MAKRRSLCSEPMSSTMTGNFCTVVMTIFLPSAMKRRRSPECSAWPTVAPNLSELLDRVADLLIKNATVGDDDHRIEHLGRILGEPHELVREPGDRVRFARAGRVLDQNPTSGALRQRVGQQLADDVQLMKSREHLIPLHLAGLRVLPLDDLGVVLDDVGQAERREDLLPQIVRLEPLCVRRIACPVVPALVERQEPGRLALELGAKLHLGVIHREMHHAPAEFEQFFARVAVALVLLDSVGDGLLGQAVLQFEGRDRQPVDEQRQIESMGRIVAAVP